LKEKILYLGEAMNKYKKDLISEKDFTMISKYATSPLLSGDEYAELKESLMGMEYDLETEEEIKESLNEVNDEAELDDTL
jgi:hypothetical protein